MSDCWFCHLVLFAKNQFEEKEGERVDLDTDGAEQ